MFFAFSNQKKKKKRQEKIRQMLPDIQNNGANKARNCHFACVWQINKINMPQCRYDIIFCCQQIAQELGRDKEIVALFFLRVYYI